jgi:hypothetical protein
MNTRVFLIAALVSALFLAALTNAHGWWRAGYRYGAYGGRVGHYNSWNGGLYHGGFRGYNSYTGRYGASRTFYNPYTGNYAHAAGFYNPYTGRYGYRYRYGY